MAGWVKWGVLGLALVYGGTLAALFAGQRKLLYPGSFQADDPGAMAGLGYGALDLDTADGVTLRHFWQAPSGGALIVYFHGNAGTAGERAEKLSPLIEAGHGLLLVEYRGYGGNPGQATEAGLVEDARAAVAWAEARAAELGRPLVLFGESLGTGLAVRLAAERAGAGRAVAGVILEAPYNAIEEVAAERYWMMPVKLLIRDRWQSFAWIEGIEAPLLIYHGEADRTVPVGQGRALFERAREPKEALFLPGAGHLNLFDVPAVPARVLDFLARVAPG